MKEKGLHRETAIPVMAMYDSNWRNAFATSSSLSLPADRIRRCRFSRSLPAPDPHRSLRFAMSPDLIREASKKRRLLRPAEERADPPSLIMFDQDFPFPVVVVSSNRRTGQMNLLDAGSSSSGRNVSRINQLSVL